MRLRWHLRTLLIGVALLAVVLAAWRAIDRRSRRFNHLAAYHLQAHEILADQAGGPLDCLEIEDGETFEAAMERRFEARGEREQLAFQASIYHWNLFETYRKAAASPCSWVAADPLPPRMANPRFHPHASHDQTLRDWDQDEPLSGGFQ